MRRAYCKHCKRIVGYYTDTGKRIHGLPLVELHLTHAKKKKIMTFPNAKEDKYKYTIDTMCDYCGEPIH